MPASRDSDSVFSLVGVTRAFGAVRAVDDVSLAFVRGETTILIGSSGSGKSTV
jgi:ABC-type Fe3+/spermidine/putrescine transport system ATPase subunit